MRGQSPRGSYIDDNRQDDLECAVQPPEVSNAEIARCFLRLANLDSGAFERLGRYEIAL